MRIVVKDAWAQAWNTILTRGGKFEHNHLFFEGPQYKILTEYGVFSYDTNCDQQFFNTLTTWTLPIDYIALGWEWVEVLKHSSVVLTIIHSHTQHSSTLWATLLANFIKGVELVLLFVNNTYLPYPIPQNMKALEQDIKRYPQLEKEGVSKTQAVVDWIIECHACASTSHLRV